MQASESPTENDLIQKSLPYPYEQPKVTEMIEPSVAPKSTEECQIEVASLNEEDIEKEIKLPPLSKFGQRAYSRVDLMNDPDKPDYEQLQKVLSETHARNKFNKPYGCYEACCNFHTGWHSLCHTSTESDLDKFGVGMVLYFRFLKYLICFFVLFSLLSIPSLYFSIKASENFGINGLKDYKGMLYFTTLGSIGRGATHCQEAKIGDTINFFCENGRLGNEIQYGRILEDKQLSCELYSMFSWDTECNNENTRPLMDAYDGCMGQTSCQFAVTEDMFDFSKRECRGLKPSRNPEAKFYFKALCDDVVLTLPGGHSLSKQDIGYIITSFDAAICLIYVIMLILLKALEKQAVTNLEGNINLIDAYTIKVSNLPEKNREELRRELWKHFSQITQNELTSTYSVVDVQLAESQLRLDLQVRLGALRKKKVCLYRRFYAKWADKSKNKNRDLTYEDIHQLARQGTARKLGEFKAIRKLKVLQDKLKAQLRHETSSKRAIVNAAYVTFETKEQRDGVFRKYQKSAFSRFCYAFCECFFKNDINVFHGTYLKVKDAPAPNNILWANLDIESSEKFLRRLLGWVITAGLWAISFAFVIFATTQQQTISKIVRPTQACSQYDNLTEKIVQEDMNKGEESLGLLECFCRASLQRQLFNSLCRDWTVQKLLANGLPFLIVAGIILTNYALQYVFRRLSSFEKYQSVTAESTSRVIKIFVAQLLNTGVIILVVNAKFTKTPLFNFMNGSYDDLTPEWYLNVGTTLLTTMIINIVNLPLVNSLSYLFKGCFRCCDRNCTCDDRQTCKETQEDWEKLYTGPEFLADFRYAQILTVVSICFVYSAGLPLLYLSTLLNLIAVYWMDKIFLLKFCKLPRMFDDKLETIVRKALYFILFLHVCFAVWTYGSPQIFGSEDSYEKIIELVNRYKDMEFTYFIVSLWDRATQEQNIVLTVLFIIFGTTFLSIMFFKHTISRIFKFCFGRRVVRIGDETRYRNRRTYYDCIHLKDLILEKKYLEREICETVDTGLKELLAKRLERILAEIEKRDPDEENPLNKFVGSFSYSVGHHPLYKRFFDTRGIQITDISTN